MVLLTSHRLQASLLIICLTLDILPDVLSNAVFQTTQSEIESINQLNKPLPNAIPTAATTTESKHEEKNRTKKFINEFPNEFNSILRAASTTRWLTWSLSSNGNRYEPTIHTGINIQAFKKFFEKFHLIDALVNANGDQFQYFTIFVPITDAFRKWQPIDWGFDPFAIDTFTKSLFRKHIVFGLFDLENAQNLLLTNIENNPLFIHNYTVLETLNENAHILKLFRKPTWQMIIVDRILYLNDDILSELHNNNKDKETPPLILGKWLLSPFLSYMHYLLADNENISIIMSILDKIYLNDAVIGTNYTFFVPINSAFDQFNESSLAALESEDTIAAVTAAADNLVLENARILLLNHLVHERVYLNDVLAAPNASLELNSLAKNRLLFQQTDKGFMINNASLISDAIYVFNVGTVYLIDSLLIPETNEVIINTK